MTHDPLVVWATIGVLLAATLLTRGSFLLFLHGTGLPPTLQRSLRFIPPAIFAALVMPELLMADGSLIASPLHDKLIAGLVAIGVGWRTRSAFAPIVAGMLALHAVRWIAPH